MENIEVTFYKPKDGEYTFVLFPTVALVKTPWAKTNDYDLTFAFMFWQLEISWEWNR